MGLYLANRFNDLIHVSAVGQEHVLGHGHGGGADLPIPLELVEALPIGLQPLSREEAFKPARLDRFIEQAIEVLFLVTARAGDPFRTKGVGELVAGQTMKLLRVIPEWIKMPDGPGVFGQTHRLNTRDLLQLGAEVIGVLTAPGSFLDQFFKLLH
jgi:hypothetical protein